MSIDNLPTQIPLDSSDHFGKCLVPLMKDFEKSEILDRAKIVRQGVLSKRFSHLEQLIMEGQL